MFPSHIFRIKKKQTKNILVETPWSGPIKNPINEAINTCIHPYIFFRLTPNIILKVNIDKHKIEKKFNTLLDIT